MKATAHPGIQIGLGGKWDYAVANENEIRKVILAAEERLQAARFGIEDLRGRPERRRAGFQNAVVFGRMVTFVIQKLRNQVQDFDSWYMDVEAELRRDPLCRYFSQLRNKIEKEAGSGIQNGVYFENTTIEDILSAAQPAPPGAVSLFVGDRDGASGWIVKLSDGSEEKYYVDLPKNIADVGLYPDDLPEGLMLEYGKLQAPEVLEIYLNKLDRVITSARRRFLSPGTS